MRRMIGRRDFLKTSGALVVGFALAPDGLAQQPPLDLYHASRLLAAMRSGEEAKEGIGAFLEKRSAAFVVKR